MVITGVTLFFVLLILAYLADRRGKASIAIGLFIVSGVILGTTTFGPPLARATQNGANGFVNAAIAFFQSF